MKTRQTSRWFWLILFAVFLGAPFVAPSVLADVVTGVVVDCHGNPVNGASVALFKVEGSNETRQGIDTTNGNGVFQFQANRGTYNVLVVCPGGSSSHSVNFSIPGKAAGMLRLVCDCPKTSAKATTTTVGGLKKINFETSAGHIIVNLPDDMMAGDTISGTVVAEPKGDTAEEKAKNQDVLNGYVIDLGGTTVDRPRFTWTPPQPNSSTPVRYELKVIEVLPPPRTKSGAAITPQPKIVARAVITPNPKITYPTTPSGAVITPDPKTNTSFIIPPLGQTGRPIVITGPFDGNSSNTSLNGTGFRTTVQDYAPKDSGTIAQYSLVPLAESPRKAVFSAPTDVTGPAEITVKEGNKETKGTFRNVGVNLTAPKTSLMKGESTELHVEVQGLQGITQPVPLRLTKGGVVTMQGGDAQTMSIKPAEVQANGTFTTTRTITGVETGVWNATATVVVFDYCLQDDNNGNTLIFSSETGDYRFCSFAPGLNIAMASIDTLGGGNLSDPNLDTGHYDDLTINKSIITFEHNNGDRRVLINLSSGSFPPSATATVQTTNPKRTFTITDRDTRNNTCTCK